MQSRRQFMLTAVPVLGLGLLGSRLACAQAKLVETDPTAVALGYKEDATKVDAKKYPTYKAGNLCNNCMLYKGKPTDAAASCGAFGDKLVVGKGWCMAWVKKA